MQIYEKFIEQLGIKAMHRASTLPQWVDSRPQLNLSQLMIRELPGWISRIQGLVELDLSQNALLELPESLENAIENLQLIDLSHNQIRVLPECLVRAHVQSQLVIRFEDNPGEHTIVAQLAAPGESISKQR